MNEQDLKIEALLEAAGQQTRMYEEKVANLRVALTQTTQQLEQSQKRIQELEEQITKDTDDLQKEEAPKL